MYLASKIILNYPFKNDYINHSKANNKIDFGCMEESWNKDEHAWGGSSCLSRKYKS